MSAREFVEWGLVLCGPSEPIVDREREHRRAVAMLDGMVR